MGDKRSQPQRGLRLFIYRRRGPDMSDGGLSARVPCVILVACAELLNHGATVGQPVPLDPSSRVFPATSANPAVVLVSGRILGQKVHYVHPFQDGERWTFGGAYVAGDALFTSLLGLDVAVPLYDRKG